MNPSQTRVIPLSHFFSLSHSTSWIFLPSCCSKQTSSCARRSREFRVCKESQFLAPFNPAFHPPSSIRRHRETSSPALAFPIRRSVRLVFSIHEIRPRYLSSFFVALLEIQPPSRSFARFSPLFFPVLPHSPFFSFFPPRVLSLPRSSCLCRLLSVFVVFTILSS